MRRVFVVAIGLITIAVAAPFATSLPASSADVKVAVRADNELGTVRTLRDPMFGEFAAYAARLVAYYNIGSFVAEDGRQILNPAAAENRATYWELWNEPDQHHSACPPGPGLSPEQYVGMWNTSADAM